MLQTLELANIRSYDNGLFEFVDSVNIIVGPNASGKTNLLESIHMIATGSAFKSADEQMVRTGEAWARIDATVDSTSRSIRLKAEPRIVKTIQIEGVEKKQLPHNQKLPVVLFEPFDMLLLGGEPERRRLYIDNLIAQLEPGYATLLKEYKRALAQRNRLLKSEQISPEHLFVWDVRISELGGKLAETRTRYVELINGEITRDYQSVSGNNETVSITYDSKLPSDGYANALLQLLKSQYDIDRARGFTGAGPHRDDLSILLNNNDVRIHASRGETRSIVLALKIAELRLLEKATGKKPLLLLDDVFSELDGKRRRTLAQTLQGYQTFITTTDADVVIDHFSTLCNIIPL